MAKRKLQALRIVSDHVKNRDNLAFGFAAYASAITELIATKSNKTPFTIGISGKWGSGKTTLMKAIEQELQKIPYNENVPIKDQAFRRIKCVWFEAWKYKEEDEVLAALIEVVISSMKENDKKLSEKINELSKSINYRKIFSLVSKAAISIDLSEFIKDPETGKSITHEDFLGFYDTFKNTFSDLLWEYLDVDKKTRNKDEQAALIIFIDDLDRCPLPKIVQILETIKLFLDEEGCIFVIGAAKDIIEKAMRDKEKYEEKDAEDFLEKIIQINFPLPKKTTENADEFIKEIKKRLSLTSTFKQDVINIILPILEHNPRRVIALFNDVSLQVGMMHHENNDIEFEKLLLWKTLEKHEKGFFNENIMDTDVYFSFLKDIEMYEQAVKDSKTITDELKEGLNNPDLVNFLKDDSIRKLMTEMNLTEKEHEVLATHSAIFKEEEPDEAEYDDFKKYIKEIEKPKTDAPKDYQEFVEIEGGDYDLEKIGNTNIKEFAIGKYPVTNKWYEEFKNDGCYSNENYWSTDGKKWLQQSNTKEPGYWNHERFNHPGQPVVGVCWYEAEAFCNWLNEKQGSDVNQYRLPTEEEWQAAAGGKEAWKYPWGDEWNMKFCNNSEIGLERTTVVGIFKKGNTKETGICDMAGNVWDWTNTKDGTLQFIRGGSWRGATGYCWVSHRSGSNPGIRDNRTGFRLAHSL